MLSRRNFILGLLTSNLIYNQNNIVSGHESEPSSVSTKQHQRNKDILIIVDVQNDFALEELCQLKMATRWLTLLIKFRIVFSIYVDSRLAPQDHSSSLQLTQI